MKILAIALVAAWGGLMLGTNALAAASHHATAPKTLVVAMHDPGCHSFLIHGKYTTKASVAGSVRLVNADENTLKVASSHGIQLIPVGKNLVLKHGHYVVTMVNQAADDNHLKLTVR
jgi:purine nucleoside permease